MEPERRTTVQTAINAAVGDNTVTKSNVYGPSGPTVFDNTVAENIFKDLFPATQPESIELTETIWKCYPQ